MKPTLFIETTIPSMYHETRKDSKLIAWREFTRELWEKRENFHFVTSPFVIEELKETPEPKRGFMLALIDEIEILESHPMIHQRAFLYGQTKLMPLDPLGDAIHLAYASFHQIEFLVTWNCKHLANAIKFPALEEFHREKGLHFPRIVTPYELLEVNL